MFYTGITNPAYILVLLICLLKKAICRTRPRRRIKPRHTLTIIVPAYNEEACLADTLDSLVTQSVPADRIIVINDYSTDRTAEIARAFRGVEVITPPYNLGSKAKAQNFALPLCDTDLVLPIDADTILGLRYVEHIKKPFADPNVVIAAGCVHSRYSRRWCERGRTIEYLFGFHWHRPIQARANAPVVCSGCCSAFRRSTLERFGGFPERTIVEDMDYTWSRQIDGYRGVYVGKAECWAADPENLGFLRVQTWRWMAGFMQNVRLHWRQLVRFKPMLAVWVFLALWDIAIAPLWWSAPVVLIWVFDRPWENVLIWYYATELGMTLPPLIYAACRRGLSIISVLVNLPFVYANKVVNNVYAWKAVIVELILVPLGYSQGLHDYVKGGRIEPAPTTPSVPAVELPEVPVLVEATALSTAGGPQVGVLAAGPALPTPQPRRARGRHRRA